MTSIYKRDLARIADEKARDAELLLANGRHSNAYYLAGYAVEIGLKAVIAAEFRDGTLPDKAFVMKIYTHDLEKLVGYAGLNNELEQRRRVDLDFSAKWAIVAGWREDSRYEAIDAVRARALIDAVTNTENGALSWLRTRW